MLLQKENSPLNKRTLLLLLVIFGLIFIRYCYYGFEYFYQLDDYIQYHNYDARLSNPFAQIMSMGMLAARPLAGCADLLVWTHFFPVMILGVLLISAMYAASAVLLQRVWSRHFGTGHLFLAVYSLLPLGFEGTYWMSAATRIVTGLFFAAAALYMFEQWCEKGKKRALVFFGLLQLISYGFYEQVLVFSATSILLSAFYHDRTQRRRSAWALLSFGNAAAYLLFVHSFPNSPLYKNRMKLLLPTNADYWSMHFPSVLDQVKKAFFEGGYYTLAKGFKRGAALLFSDVNVLYIVGVLALSAALFFLTKHSPPQKKRSAVGFVAGLILALAPVLPFFFFENSWFSLRGTVTSFCGIALMADALFVMVISKAKDGRLITACTAAVLAIIFCTASISELYDYRQTTANDRNVEALLADALREDGNLDKNLNVGILNLKPTYLTDQNYNYHEHIQGVTSSYWALYGVLECYNGSNIPNVFPLPEGTMYYPWDCDRMRLGNFDVLYLYDGNNRITNINAVPQGNEEYILYLEDGTPAGYTWECGRHGYLQLYF
jgi:hypothetical protein